MQSGTVPATWFGHPKGLAILFLTEMWEKLSFYGMRVLLIYYMVKHLQFPHGFASTVYGLYTGCVYLTPILGGILADRWLGRRKAVLVGGAIMALGHFILAFEAHFFLALAVICIGNGLFLPNLPGQVDDLYEKDDPRRGSAYNIYYVGINLGGLLAPLVCGTLGELYGWHVGFGAAGVGMCLGLAIYAAGLRHLPAERPASVVPAAPSRPSLPKRDIQLLALVAVAVVIFRAAYEQTGNTLALWVDQSVDRHVLGAHIAATWVQGFNPLFVFIFTPLLVSRRFRHAEWFMRAKPLNKMLLGALGVALSYVLLAGVAWTSHGQLVGFGWIVAFFALFTLSEIFILPVGLSLFASLSPSRLRGTLIAAWFLASFGGNLLAGVVGRAWVALGPELFFLGMAALACVSAAVLSLGRAVGKEA